MTFIFSLWQVDLARQYETLDLFTNETHPQFQLMKVKNGIYIIFFNIIVGVNFSRLFLMYLRKTL